MPRKKTVVQTSDPQPVRVGKLGPLTDPAELVERFKNYPAIDVLSRRLTNPNSPGSLPILLSDEDRHACVNSDHMNRLRPGATVCTARDQQTGRQCGKPARKWYVRWFNLASEGRNAQMRAMGYVGVEVAELPDANDIADLYRAKDDRYVRRGDHGKEILAKMPLEFYNNIKANQRREWNKTALQPKKVQASIATALGQEHGDEAGQTMHDGGIQLESFTRSHSTLGEESGEEVDA